MKDERGFTIVEILIAVIVLTIGLLGLVATAALVTRMIARGQRSAMAAMFATQRMERMRPAACIDAQRVAGSDTLFRGSTWVAINNWSFVDEGKQYYRMLVVTISKVQANQLRVDTLEAGIPCRA